MNLIDTVRGLEAKGVTVAINLGVHEGCEIDSNCPLAIQLRRLIADSGTTLEQLLEGYQEVTNPAPIHYDLPQFNSKAHIEIAGKVVEVDLNDIVSTQLKDRITYKLRDLDRMGRQVKDLGTSLYSSYLREIARQRDNHTLPQFDYNVRDLVSTKCSITCHRGNYLFLFSIDYNPQYIVTDGIRYKIADRDIRTLKRRAHLEFRISPDNKILEVRLLDESGDKLEHYHGNDNGGDDCWGTVVFPERWDRSLSSLYRLVQSIAKVLSTINKDSLVYNHPEDMSSIDSLMSRSTKLGREGELNVDAVTGEPTGGWGRGTWTARGTPMIMETDANEQPLTEAERRFGRGFNNENMAAICAICGRPYGEHFGNRDGDATCPRDHHPTRRRR